MPSFSETQWQAKQDTHAAELDAARAQCRLYEADISRLCDEANAASAQWDALPWDAISEAVYWWELGRTADDAMRDLRVWFDAKKPQEYAE